MIASQDRLCTAFEGTRCIASGVLNDVALKTKAVIDRGERASVLIFDDLSGHVIDVDYRGVPEQVLARLQVLADTPSSHVIEAPRRVGRPNLGVVAREVTLLPRHWDWLNRQPGGASVALRKLVEQARRANDGKDKIRQAQEAAYRFISAMAGNEPGFEEAARALFAGNSSKFAEHIDAWPVDVRDHAKRLAEGAFPELTT
jgi:hypothetical protein